jgi:hypothetical protein
VTHYHLAADQPTRSLTDPRGGLACGELLDPPEATRIPGHDLLSAHVISMRWDEVPMVAPRVGVRDHRAARLSVHGSLCGGLPRAGAATAGRVAVTRAGWVASDG